MLHQFSLEALGTQRHIAYEYDDNFFDTTLSDIIKQFESRYSRFSTTSLISQLNRDKNMHADDEFLTILQAGYKMYKKTGGIFSPFVGSVLYNLGYDEQYSFQAKDKLSEIQSEFSIQQQTVLLGENTTFDIGGYGKGRLIDMLATFFNDNGCNNRIINGGGDIRFHRDDTVYQQPIGIPHQFCSDMLIAERNTKSGAITTSSAELRKRGKNHHLINPLESEPVDNRILSVSVFASTTYLADVASTALYVGGESQLEELSEKLGVGYLVLFKDNSVTYSSEVLGLTVFDGSKDC